MGQMMGLEQFQSKAPGEPCSPPVSTAATQLFSSAKAEENANESHHPPHLWKSKRFSEWMMGLERAAEGREVKKCPGDTFLARGRVLWVPVALPLRAGVIAWED